ncbi:hypothetical protein SLEP1_g56019 [Rubroshorea leprosula]|uniref:Uncharacterized protein n=1 Tax=Rubroshorea leprosula TaxID=152421 RepID=A0AAV5MKF0_9ROSI|nr:hypothetical protein SLEP1_g56019 [Rubroshorea leprosula]
MHQIRKPSSWTTPPVLPSPKSQVPTEVLCLSSLPSPTPPALPSLSAVYDRRRCSVALCFLQLLICSPHRTCSLPSANALSPELLSALTEPKLLSAFC